MTAKQQAEVLFASLRGSSEEDAIDELRAALELAWLKGWEVARAQMVAAGEQFELVLKNASYLALTGPKSATQGVHSFVDGLKGAERPTCVL